MKVAKGNKRPVTEEPRPEPNEDERRARTRWGRIKLRSLDELDGRTAAARRARDLIAHLVADAGGNDNITEGMRQLITRAAVIAAYVEDIEARWISGGNIKVEEYLAAANTQKRILEAVGLQRVPRNITPSLTEYLGRTARQ
ncbi:MAG TPA: hypothetical protein VH678_32920 [Xanthobacteraceae bacterium]|jgi:hypothetical protein